MYEKYEVFLQCRERRSIYDWGVRDGFVELSSEAYVRWCVKIGMRGRTDSESGCQSEDMTNALYILAST